MGVYGMSNGITIVIEALVSESLLLLENGLKYLLLIFKFGRLTEMLENVLKCPTKLVKSGL